MTKNPRINENAKTQYPMKKDHLNIGVDIDGVILDFVGSFIHTSQRHGVEISHEQVYCYDLSQVLGVPKSIIAEWIQETLEGNEFDLIEGAKEALQTLYKNHTIMLVTSQSRVFRENTEAVLRKHGIPFHFLGFVEFLQKHTVLPKPDVFIEDSIEEALSLKQNIDKILLFDQPWNRGSLNVMHNFERVYSWNNIVEEIEQMISPSVLSRRPSSAS